MEFQTRRPSEMFSVNVYRIDGESTANYAHGAVRWDNDTECSMENEVGNRGGCLKGRVRLTEIGMWRLSITYTVEGEKDAHVQGSPIDLHIVPGVICPKACSWKEMNCATNEEQSPNNQPVEVEQQGTAPAAIKLEAGTPRTFCFQARDKFGNLLNTGGHKLDAKLRYGKGKVGDHKSNIRDDGVNDNESVDNNQDTEADCCNSDSLSETSQSH